MSKKSLCVASAVVAAVSMAGVHPASAEKTKCYGAAFDTNDCADKLGTHSCQGQMDKNKPCDPNEWILTLKNKCEDAKKECQAKKKAKASGKDNK